jgi:hypothetical protein
MKKLCMAALIGLLAACGGGGKTKPDARIIVGGIDAPTTVTDKCNVLAQTGCAAGEKCTWFTDSVSGDTQTGHVDCAPSGPVALNGACKIGDGGATATGFDDCAKGLYCSGRVCKTVCDPAGNEPACGENLACAIYTNTFSNEGDPARAGVCDPTCNTLTQRLDGVTGAAGEACGGTVMNNVPTRGCYGFWDEAGRSRFSCARSGDPALTQDQVLPARRFINSCAAGFGGFLRKESGSMEAICSAFCGPGDVYKEATVDETGGKPAADTCLRRMKTFTPAVPYDCIRGFVFEADMMGRIQETAYSNKAFCWALPKYKDSMMVPFKTCKELTKGTDLATDEALGNGCRDLNTYDPPAFAPTQEYKSYTIKANSALRHSISPMYTMEFQQ